MAEHRFRKAVTRVRFPPSAPNRWLIRKENPPILAAFFICANVELPNRTPIQLRVLFLPQARVKKVVARVLALVETSVRAKVRIMQNTRAEESTGEGKPDPRPIGYSGVTGSLCFVNKRTPF